MCAFSIHGLSVIYMFHADTLEKRHHISGKDFVSPPSPPNPILLFSLLVTSHLGVSRNTHPGGRAKACWKVLTHLPLQPARDVKRNWRESNVRPEDVEIQSVV